MLVLGHAFALYLDLGPHQGRLQLTGSCCSLAGAHVTVLTLRGVLTASFSGSLVQQWGVEAPKDCTFCRVCWIAKGIKAVHALAHAPDRPMRSAHVVDVLAVCTTR